MTHRLAEYQQQTFVTSNQSMHDISQ